MKTICARIIIFIYTTFLLSICNAYAQKKIPYALKSSSNAILYKDECVKPDSFKIKKISGHFGVRILLNKDLKVSRFFVFDLTVYRDSMLIINYSNYSTNSPIYEKNVYDISSINYPNEIHAYMSFIKGCIREMIFKRKKGYKMRHGYYTLIVSKRF